MELKKIELSEINKLKDENVIIVISNGEMKYKEIPAFGTVEITSHNNEVKFVEDHIKHKF